MPKILFLSLILCLFSGAAMAQADLQQGMPPMPMGASPLPVDANFAIVDYKQLAEGTSEEALFDARGKIYERIQKECSRIKQALGTQCALKSLNFTIVPFMDPAGMLAPPVPAPASGKAAEPVKPPQQKMQIIARATLALGGK